MPAFPILKVGSVPIAPIVQRSRAGVKSPALCVLVAFLGLLICGTSAHAGIISTTGQVQIVAPPPSLQNGAFTDNTNARIIQEKGPFVLPVGVSVNIDAPGTYNSNASLTGGSILAGTDVISYILHSDTNSEGALRYRGSITFDSPVIGIIVKSTPRTDDLLTQSDPILGHPGTLYANDLNRGLELGNPTDSIILSADRLTVTFDFRTSGALDDARIVIAAPVTAVPEPATLTLLGLGLAGVLGLRRLRKV